jgi:predicted GNAT family acetyltransferase
MTAILRTNCVCGWETTGKEDDVVDATLDHGLRVHNMAGTREQVLERAERVGGEGDPEPEVRIVDAPARSRFELLVGDRVVGFTEYELVGDRISLNHTEIDPDVEGRGYGSRLAAGVLDATGERGLDVIVMCPFITAYLRRHKADFPDVDLHAGKARIGRTV